MKSRRRKLEKKEKKIIIRENNLMVLIKEGINYFSSVSRSKIHPVSRKRYRWSKLKISFLKIREANRKLNNWIRCWRNSITAFTFVKIQRNKYEREKERERGKEQKGKNFLLRIVLDFEGSENKKSGHPLVQASK